MKESKTLGEPNRPFLGRLFALVPSRLTLRARLLLSFVAMILFFGLVWSLLGVGLIRRSLPQAQDLLAVDLSAALEVYREHVSQITDVLRLIARQHSVQQHLERGDPENLEAPFESMGRNEDLDLLFLTDSSGQVLLPAASRGRKIEEPEVSLIVEQVLEQHKEIAATIVVSAKDLIRDSPALAQRARIDVVSTSYAGSEQPGNVSDGLFAAAAVPVLGDNGELR